MFQFKVQSDCQVMKRIVMALVQMYIKSLQRMCSYEKADKVIPETIVYF